MLKREQKIKEVTALKEKFQSAKAVLFAENKGLKVSEFDGLRKALRQEKIEIKVVKNRLLRRALKEASIPGLEEYIGGSLTLTSAEGDPVTPAKILIDFVKEHEALVVKGGWVDGAPYPFERIKALASLPSRPELYAQLLRCLQGPAAGLAQVLAAVPRQLVTVLDAVRKQKETT